MRRVLQHAAKLHRSTNHTMAGRGLRLMTTATPAPAERSGGGSSLVTAALLAGTGYCAYELYQVVAAWPEPCAKLHQTASSNAEVLEVFGGVVRAGWAWDGRVTDDSVTVAIPLSGSDGRRGVLHGHAIKVPLKPGQPAEWKLISAEVEVLREPAAAADAAAAAAPTAAAPTSPAAPAAPVGSEKNPFGTHVERVIDCLAGRTITAKDIDTIESLKMTPGAVAAATSRKL